MSDIIPIGIMEDNGELNSISPEVEEIGKQLIGHKIYENNIDTLEKVIKTPEFQLLKLIFEEDDTSFDSIVEKFNTRRFLSNIISSLEINNFIENDDGELNPSAMLLNLLLEAKLSLDEDTSIDLEQISEIEQFTQEQLQKIDDAIDESKSRAKTKIEQEKVAMTEQPAEVDISQAEQSISDKFSGLEDKIAKVDEQEKISSETETTTQSEVSEFDDLDDEQSLRPKKRESGAFTEEQLDEIDKAIIGDREKKEKLLSSMSKDLEDEDQSDDLDFDSLFNEALGGSLTDVLGDIEELEVESSTGTDVSGIQPLIDLLKEYNYINEAQGFDDAVTTPEYQILLAVLKKHPITTEEIEEHITSDTLVSMTLSNLKADDLIDQTNDYRWTISKLVLERLKSIVQDTKDEDQTVEKLDDDRELFLNYIDKERAQFKEAVYKMNYIADNKEDVSTYLEVPEVEILNIIRSAGPINTEEIKQRADNTLPVVVKQMISRLHADGAIISDPDGNWQISTKFLYLMVKDNMKGSMAEKELETFDNKYV